MNDKLSLEGIERLERAVSYLNLHWDVANFDATMDAIRILDKIVFADYKRPNQNE